MQFPDTFLRCRWNPPSPSLYSHLQRHTFQKNAKYPKKIFSGAQPTGAIHIGNYLGAIRQWVDMQNSGENVTYCIVDLHSITLPQDPIELKKNILGLAATFLACGIDPQKSTLFIQSDVKQHAELSWILGCLTTMPRLGHLPQYKEKSKSLKEIPLGLFVYPVLQAADVLMYKWVVLRIIRSIPCNFYYFLPERPTFL